jgi:hypothetical protein
MQLSRDVPADAGLLCDKDAVLGAARKDTVSMSIVWTTMVIASDGYVL